MWATRLPPVRWTLSRALSTGRSNIGLCGPRNTLRRKEILRRRVQPSASSPSQSSETPVAPSYDPTTPSYDPAANTLLSPVHIPEDPNGVLKENHPATGILANSGLVVQRQLELMNVMIGFEQANKYVIMDAHGNHIGYMAEQEKGMGNMMARQWFRTHRSFVTHVFDRHENEVLRFHRPFSWINSRIRVYDPLDIASTTYSSSTALQSVSPGSLVQATGGSNARVSPLGFDEMRVIGEAQQVWAPLRRKYDLFLYHHLPNTAAEVKTERLSLSGTDLSIAQRAQLATTSHQGPGIGEYTQFAYVNEPFLSWDFSLRSADDRLIGSVNRNFVGFARELFTDTGVYALRMDSATLAPDESTNTQNQHSPGMTLDQRAVMLATAVSVDFDYFSRHSGAGGFGFMPIWFPGIGGEAAAGGAAAGGAAAGEAGVVGAGEAAAGALGRAGATAGIAEGAAAGVAGAGAMAGYDAMQRGMYGEHGEQPLPTPGEQQQLGDQGLPTPGETDFYADNPWAQPRDDPWSTGGLDQAEGDADGEGEGDDWFDF